MVRTCDSLEVLQTAGRGRVDGATLVLTHQQLPVPANIVLILFIFWPRRRDHPFSSWLVDGATLILAYQQLPVPANTNVRKLFIFRPRKRERPSSSGDMTFRTWRTTTYPSLKTLKNEVNKQDFGSYGILKKPHQSHFSPKITSFTLIVFCHSLTGSAYHSPFELQ